MSDRPDREPPGAAVPARRPAAPAQAPIHVLCVDDEPRILKALTLQLQRRFRISTADSGAAALEFLRRNPDVAVIISDMRMPQMDGATFLRHSREAAPLAVRILLTGESDTQSAIAAVNDGQVFRFLTKPCPPDVLLEALEAAIAQQQHNASREAAQAVLSFYDPVTRLANRRLFAERTRNLLAEAQRERNTLALLYLDLDRFTHLSGSLGQTGSEEVLRIVAGRLTQAAGDPALLANVGGDRFCVLLRGVRRDGLADIVRARFLQPVQAPMSVAGQDVELTAHVGVALFPDDAADSESLMRNAATALRKSRSGPEPVLIYTQELGAAVDARTTMLAQLRRAVDRDEFRLHYQPKVDLRNGEICGCEALLRWEHPQLGMVPPLRFVGLLEETGLIVEVGDWVLRHAAEQHARWTAAGLRPAPIAVNVSPVQLHRSDFVARVRANALGGAEPCLSLEITESILMADTHGARDKLRQLRQLGIAIAIDDFGTGYSSLSYLADLAVSAVKIDRSFVVRMGESADSMAIVSGIIGLAHALSLQIIAEGVDSAEQLKFLRLLRCDEYQGYLYSEPLPPDHYENLLRQGRVSP